MERVDVRRCWQLWAGAVASVMLVSLRPPPPTDVWLYAATGRWILEHRTIPHSDPLSWTYLGEPWQSNGWAWGVVVDRAFGIGGHLGITALSAIFVGLIAAGVVLAARTLGARLVPALIGSVAVILLIQPWITPRPQIASFALFPLAIASAARATAGGRWHGRWFVALAAVFVVWANCHAAVLVGAAVVLAMLGVQVIQTVVRERQLRPALPSVAAGAVVAVATFCMPYGFAMFTWARWVRELSRATISEWYPVWRGGSDIAVPVAALAMFVVGVVVLKAWRRPTLLAPLFVCWLLAWDSIRNTPYLVSGMVIFLAPLLPATVVPAMRGRFDLARIAVGAGLGFAVVLTIVSWSKVTSPNVKAPIAATAALPSGCRMRNDYRVGGWMLFHRPDVPVSIDGRNDMYGLQGYDQQRYFEDEDGAREADATFKAQGVNCVVAIPGDPIIPALEAAGWRKVAADAGGVLLLPRDG